jgi:hypothetical protein
MSEARDLQAQHGGETQREAVHATVHGTVHLPAPTAWPILMALGVILIFFSLVTSVWLMWLGLGLLIGPAIGWFRDVLPHEAHVDLEVDTRIVELEPSMEGVAKIEVTETHRAQLPLQTFTFASGIKGGIAGGIAMLIPAELYGIIRFHSVWYVVNLLGGAGVAGWNPSEHDLTTFHLAPFLIAIVIHTASSFLVGLLYGALLPAMPRHPIVLGGLVAPALWTGLLHSTLGLLNPFFDDHINWYWFALSQVGYGVVAGWVVAREGRLKSLRGVPLSVRLGVERPEAPREDDEDKR